MQLTEIRQEYFGLANRSRHIEMIECRADEPPTSEDAFIDAYLDRGKEGPFGGAVLRSVSDYQRVSNQEARERVAQFTSKGGHDKALQNLLNRIDDLLSDCTTRSYVLQPGESTDSGEEPDEGEIFDNYEVIVMQGDTLLALILTADV
jgi:hypothetical protein